MTWQHIIALTVAAMYGATLVYNEIQIRRGWAVKNRKVIIIYGAKWTPADSKDSERRLARYQYEHLKYKKERSAQAEDRMVRVGIGRVVR